MSASYYHCPKCNNQFSNCGEFYYCDAGHYFCSEECAKPKFLKHKNGDYMGCCICRKELAPDDELLEALLKHFHLTRKQATKIWKEEK